MTIILFEIHTSHNRIKEVIKTISENILQEEVTINHYINDNKSIYTIIPKVKIDVIYGFANLSSNNQISGCF